MESRESSPTSASSQVGDTRSGLFSGRSLRQFGLFAAGAGFFAVTMAITKRSIMRKYHRDLPKFFSPSHPPKIEVNGAMDALEALNLATINICSLTLMTAGGMLWAFDISSINDMRYRLRQNITTGQGLGHTQKDELSDQVIEEWLTSLLEKKEFKSILNNPRLITEQLQAKIKNKKMESNEQEKKQ